MFQQAGNREIHGRETRTFAHSLPLYVGKYQVTDTEENNSIIIGILQYIYYHPTSSLLSFHLLFFSLTRAHLSLSSTPSLPLSLSLLLRPGCGFNQRLALLTTPFPVHLPSICPVQSTTNLYLYTTIDVVLFNPHISHSLCSGLFQASSLVSQALVSLPVAVSLFFRIQNRASSLSLSPCQPPINDWRSSLFNPLQPHHQPSAYCCSPSR